MWTVRIGLLVMPQSSQRQTQWIMSRGGNELSRAEPDVNRPEPVMKKEIIGLGLGLDEGFFFRKKPRPAKNV